jgi:mycothiol synthase
MARRERPYTNEDRPRIEAALATWTHEAGGLGYCHTGEIPHRIYENLAGRRPVGEVVRVWDDDGVIAGVAITTRYDRAFDLFVAPSVRGTDAELEMLERAYLTTLGFVAELGTEDRSVVTDVFDGDDTRVELLARLGFERYRLWDYAVERDLSEPIDSPRLPDGFTIRRATLGDAAGLARARNDSFQSDWTADSYRTQVLEQPGWEVGHEFVVVAPDGEIAAFAGVWLDELNRVGHFEPVGTHAGYRRRGLARAAMLDGLLAMRTLGMARATLDYDAENTAAGALYEGLGFVKQFELFGYRR